MLNIQYLKRSLAVTACTVSVWTQFNHYVQIKRPFWWRQVLPKDIGNDDFLNFRIKLYSKIRKLFFKWARGMRMNFAMGRGRQSRTTHEQNFVLRVVNESRRSVNLLVVAKVQNNLYQHKSVTWLNKRLMKVKFSAD